MSAALIGIVSGIITILLIALLKLRDTKLIYGLILCGIGFLYVGFVWTDLKALVITAVQAMVFLLLGYYGIKKTTNILAAGYFLHGSWDMAYNLLAVPGLIPPHYDWFCLSIDFTIGIYLLLLKRQLPLKKNIA